MGWWTGSEIPEVIQDFGAGPVLGADELAADDAFGINDVGFGRPSGVEGVVGTLRGVEDGGDAGDVVVGEVLTVGLGVFVEAHGEDDDVGHLALELHQRGEFLKARRAPAGPEVQDNDFAAVLPEADLLGAVLDGDTGGVLAHLGGMAGAIAGDAEHRAQSTEHGTSRPEQGTTDHVPIIVGSLEACGPNRPAVDPFGHHSCAQ